MACSSCPGTLINGKKYVVDSSVSFGPPPTFPYWLLLLAPLLLIPILKKK